MDLDKALYMAETDEDVFSALEYVNATGILAAEVRKLQTENDHMAASLLKLMEDLEKEQETSVRRLNLAISHGSRAFVNQGLANLIKTIREEGIVSYSATGVALIVNGAPQLIDRLYMALTVPVRTEVVECDDVGAKYPYCREEDMAEYIKSLQE